MNKLRILINIENLCNDYIISGKKKPRFLGKNLGIKRGYLLLNILGGCS
jgi:hypothetical protein